MAKRFPYIYMTITSWVRSQLFECPPSGKASATTSVGFHSFEEERVTDLILSTVEESKKVYFSVHNIMADFVFPSVTNEKCL